MAVPDAVKFATVGTATEQKDCEVAPVGAEGVNGCALMIALPEETEVQPEEIKVTVNE